jgi:hypothetical protein
LSSSSFVGTTSGRETAYHCPHRLLLQEQIRPYLVDLGLLRYWRFLISLWIWFWDEVLLAANHLILGRMCLALAMLWAGVIANAMFDRQKPIIM